MITQVDDQK